MSRLASFCQPWLDWGPAGRRHGQAGHQPDHADFLPAALEIQQSPASPLGRAIMFTIMGCVAAGILWAYVDAVDILAVAQGKIIPSGHSKIIQPLESGVIRAIYVRDAQAVRAGEPLIGLDTTATGADQDRSKNELVSARVEAARLRAVLKGQRSFVPSAEPAAPSSPCSSNC